jgi:hypothetical protein
MDMSVNNPKLSLPPEMILGLLKELAASDSPIIKDFHALLSWHPVSRANHAGTTSPVSSKKPGKSSSKVSSSIVEPTVAGDASRENEAHSGRNASGSSGNRCCWNGIKQTKFDNL